MIMESHTCAYLPSTCVYASANHQKGKGTIDKDDLREVCSQFQLAVSGPVLDGLMDYCDLDKDGLINFLEFANFLTWKDKMPIRSHELQNITKGHFHKIKPSLKDFGHP